MTNMGDSTAGRREGGFSLLEVMIVVAFIGILTSIAIPNYLNFQKRARAAEVRSNLGAIRSSFVAYFTEADTYDIGDLGTLSYDSSDNEGAPYGSSATAQGVNRQWDRDTLFSTLGFNAEGAVFFNYSLDTGVAAFTAMASADLNGDLLVSHYYITSSSTAIEHAGDRF